MRGWIAFSIALVVAIVFGVLWFFRSGDLDRVNMELAQARQAAQRTETDLRTARDDADTAARRITELENQVREESRRAADMVASTERRLTTDLDIANQRLATATAELQGLRDNAPDGSLADVQGELQEAQAELESLRSASEERIAALTRELEATRTRLSEAERQAAAAPETAAASAAGSPSAASAATPTDSGQAAIAVLPAAADTAAAVEAARAEAMQQADQRVAAAEQAGAERLAAAEQRWTAELRSARREAETAKAAVDSLAAEQVKQTQAWQTRLADKDAEYADRMAELRQDAANSRNEAATASAAAAKAAGQLELLQSAYVRQSETLKQTSERFNQEATKLVARLALLEDALADYAPGGSKFGRIPVGRSVGRIVQRIDDGPVMVIDTGTKEGVKPGMKFDVYRPVGDANRYVGMVKVIRVLDDGAMVVSTYDQIHTLVCPRTGRVVFEPEARYSPFAVDKDGKAIELVCSNTVDMPLEAPAVGDILDNPFFSPDKRYHFYLEDGVYDPCLLESLRILSGAANVGQWTSTPDFIVSAEDRPNDGTGGLRVKPEHILRYVDLGTQ